MKPKKATPWFFKVLIRDFTSRLSIPPAFVKNFIRRSIIGKSVSVMSPLGANWIVKLEENQEKLCFTSGWQQFVKDHSLETGDFIVFKYYGKTKFKAKIFDTSAREKFRNPPTGNGGRVKTETCQSDDEKNGINSNNGGKREQQHKRKTISSSDFQSENPGFRTPCTYARKFQLSIPRKLAVEQGLKKKKQVVVKDPSGKSWAIKLGTRKDGRLLLKDRWAKLWRENKIETGDTLIFELTRPNVMQVHVFRGEGITYNKRTQILDTAAVKKCDN